MNHPVTNAVRPTALVTGACSGIGLEYSRQLAERGYDLIMVSNRPKELECAAEKIAGQSGITARTLYADLSDPSSAGKVSAYCRENNIEIEVLVNNAGIFSFNETVKTNPELVKTMLNLHVTTPTLLCRLLGEEMKQRGRGFILNMSSLSAWMPLPGIALYNSTKAYLRNFSRSLHYEMKESGVGVTVVCPGAVATNLYRLNPKYQKLGLRLGILMTPQKMVKKALKGTFRKKRQVIPGFANRLFIPMIAALPTPLILYVKRKLAVYEK